MAQKKITHIVLHYSATPRDQDIGVKEIDAMHKKRGWKGVGYHYVIRLDGTIERGRPESEVGAHVAGQNTGKIGICCIGGVERGRPDVGLDTRTPAQKDAQIRLIRNILTRHPGAKVVGHRDLAATQCPGFDVIPWWKSVQGGGVPLAKPAEKPVDARKPAPAATQSSGGANRAPAPRQAGKQSLPALLAAIVLAGVAAAIAFLSKG